MASWDLLGRDDVVGCEVVIELLDGTFMCEFGLVWFGDEC